jgi:hypothetical protein
MKAGHLLLTLLCSCVLGSCQSTQKTPAEIQAKASTMARVDVKTVELRPFTTGNASSAAPVSSAEISIFGTSNLPDIEGFRLIFVSKSNLRPPYLQSKRWVVHQELDSMPSWIATLKSITKNEDVAVTLWQTPDGAYTLSALRLLTRG